MVAAPDHSSHAWLCRNRHDETPTFDELRLQLHWSGCRLCRDQDAVERRLVWNTEHAWGCCSDLGARAHTGFGGGIHPWPDSIAGLDRITARMPVLALSNAAPTTLL